MLTILNHHLYILRAALIRQYYKYTFNFSYIAGASSVFISSLIITIIFVGTCQLGWLQQTELSVFDWMVRTRPDLGIDPRLLVVKITEADIQLQRRWPFQMRP
ncbi:MAG: CHASE2 domain-containing protein [Thiotrichaceae bacterium]